MLMPTRKGQALHATDRKELSVLAGHQPIRRDLNREALSGSLPVAAGARLLAHLGTSYQANWLTRLVAFALDRRIQWRRTAVSA